jgi:DNA repair protein RadA/Sms
LAAASILGEVSAQDVPRLATGSQEFDRVLGGGLVPGSAVLISGSPGAGKSTLLIQTLCKLAEQHQALYVTGEESLAQIAMRARRLQLPVDKLRVMAQTNVESILATWDQMKPKLIVIDSIQVMYLDGLESAPGGVAQVRESASLLIQQAKRTDTILLLVGHVTKEGNLAGPRVLEHMIDCFVMLEGDNDGRYRTLRASKNRFGAVNELGIFAMTEKGMAEVSNPSAIFLSRGEEAAPGSIVMVVWEGTRPLLVEAQALVDTSALGNPRRVAVGFEQNRLAMLLAVLHRHGGLQVGDQDVFVNAVGGIRVTETSSDLALLLAVVSSFRDRALPMDMICFGEVGLSGEIRPVPNGQDRLREAAKHGFRHAIVPKANLPKQPIKGMKITGVAKLQDALEAIGA